MRGTHIIADMYDCAADNELMLDAEKLSQACLNACAQAGLEAVGHAFHQFGTPQCPAGSTGTVVLAESHLAVHTWPELGAVTLDIYVCNFSRDNRARAENLYETIHALFNPARVERQTVSRGELADATRTPQPTSIIQTSVLRKPN